MAVWAAHEETELPIGANFAGYRIDGVAGAGRMGVVYRATHPGLGRVVALKLIARELSDAYAFRQRFRAESQQAATVGLIAQAGAPLIYERGESVGRLFLVMRYVRGTDLGALVAREGPLEPDRAVAIVRAVAATLDVAHRRGIVHGDLRPGHVLVPDDPRAPACLIDFGLTPVGAGLPGYVAPEQLAGEPATARSDIHALGGVLLHALTGATPSGPLAVADHVPPALTATIARAMRRSPGDRPASAGELARAAVAALPEAAPPGPPSRTRRRRAGTLPLAAAFVGGLLIALLAVTGVVGGTDPGQRPRAAVQRSAATVRPAAAARPAVVATIRVGQRADGIAFADGAVWIAAPGDDELVRVDARTDRVTGRANAGADPDSVAAGGGFAWVSSRGDGHVRRFAAAGGLTPSGAPSVGAKPEGIALDRDVAWVVSSVDDTVTGVDRTTGVAVGRPIPVGEQPIEISHGPSGVWTANSADGTVTHIDPATRQTVGRPIRVGRQPKGIAEGLGSVWVANTGDGTVTRIDPRTHRTIATIRVGHEPSKLVVAAGHVWVTNFGDGTVSRIDPRTNDVAGRPIRVGARPVGIAFGAGHLWVAGLGDGTVTKISP
jgi:YVTN family beta-propeller protein